MSHVVSRVIFVRVPTDSTSPLNRRPAGVRILHRKIVINASNAAATSADPSFHRQHNCLLPPAVTGDRRPLHHRRVRRSTNSNGIIPRNIVMDLEIAEDSLRDDSSSPSSPSSSLRKLLLVRACHLEEDLAALEAAVAVTASASAAAADAVEAQPAEHAELAFRGCYTGTPSEIERRNRRIAFGRFVDLLEQSMLPGRGGAATIRTFMIEGNFVYYYFDVSSCCREEDLERLFLDVLPNHPTVDRIRLGVSHVPARYASLLVSSVPATRATPLLELTLEFVGGPSECVICDMLRRDVPLRALTLVSSLESSACRQILESLAANTHLEGLAICFRKARADMFCLKSTGTSDLVHHGRIHAGRGGIVGPGPEDQHRPCRAARYGGFRLHFGCPCPGDCAGKAQHHNPKPLGPVP
jgi:hypothetical protein